MKNKQFPSKELKILSFILFRAVGRKIWFYFLMALDHIILYLDRQKCKNVFIFKIKIDGSLKKNYANYDFDQSYKDIKITCLKVSNFLYLKDYLLIELANKNENLLRLFK
jgi:hypothetical protein